MENIFYISQEGSHKVIFMVQPYVCKNKMSIMSKGIEEQKKFSLGEEMAHYFYF